MNRRDCRKLSPPSTYQWMHKEPGCELNKGASSSAVKPKTYWLHGWKSREIGVHYFPGPYGVAPHPTVTSRLRGAMELGQKPPSRYWVHKGAKPFTGGEEVTNSDHPNTAVL